MQPSARPKSLGYGRQHVDQADVEAVLQALGGSHLTQGESVERFEEGLCRATCAPFAVACSNGTSALQLAYMALDVGPGTRVLTTANTFLASATAAIHCAAEVEFLDIELSSGNLNLDLLEARCEQPLAPQVVTIVHFAGLPCDMQRLIELKRRFGFKLVEDAAHALGARYRVDGRWWGVGEHPEVDASTLSFHPVKHITTGEGGAVLTSDPRRAQRLRLLRSHGMDKHAVFDMNAPMIELGLNARLSDLNAALGSSQLGKLSDFLADRRELAMTYRARLAGFELLDGGDSEREHAWHLFVLRVPQEARGELVHTLRQEGIGCQLHYYPVPLQPWFQAHGVRGSWPAALSHAQTSLSIPIYPALEDQDQDRVIQVLQRWGHTRSAA